MIEIVRCFYLCNNRHFPLKRNKRKTLAFVKSSKAFCCTQRGAVFFSNILEVFVYHIILTTESQ